MIRITLISMMLMLCTRSISAQDPPLYGEEAEINTPNNSPVPDSWRKTAEFMSSATIISLNNVYDSIPEVINRTMSASSYYNCRGYAWYMSDGHPNDEVWIGAGLPNADSVYWTDGSYISVPFGFATKVRYEGEHTAIIVSHDSMICESKWGAYPGFTHDIGWLPEMDESIPLNYVCYAKPITVYGTLTSGTYSVNSDDDLSGTSYTWNAGPFLSIASGGTTSSCTVSKSYRFPGNSDESWVEVSLERYGSTLVIRKDIDLGDPATITISGPTSPCASSTATYTVNNIPQEATIVWSSGTGLTRTSAQGANPCNFSVSGSGTSSVSASITYTGLTYNTSFSVDRLSLPVPSTPTMNVVGANGDNGNYTVALNSSLVYFTLSGGGGYSYGWYTYGISCGYSITDNALDLYPDVTGYNMISGYVYNACHQSQSVSAYLEVTEYRRSVPDSLSISLSPNPASQFVDIELVTWGELVVDNDYLIEFVDAYSRVVKQVTLSGTMNRVNIQDLQKGYYVVMLHFGKRISSAILLIE